MKRWVFLRMNWKPWNLGVWIDSISPLTPDQNLANIEFSKTINRELYESNLILEPSHPVNDVTFRVFFQIEMQWFQGERKRNHNPMRGVWSIFSWGPWRADEEYSKPIISIKGSLMKSIDFKSLHRHSGNCSGDDVDGEIRIPSGTLSNPMCSFGRYDRNGLCRLPVIWYE